MEFLMLFLCVTPAFVSTISISPNGNSPKVKMIGGRMVDAGVQRGFVPMTPKAVETISAKSNYEKSRELNINSTKLALNERYRRLIPYMTFYYANDLVVPPTEHARNVEVEKAKIVEAKELANQRQPKKIYYSQQNIPRYQGNRLTQYNIASANPTKIYYKNGVPIYQGPSKATPNFNPLVTDLPVYDYDLGRITQKLTKKSPSIAFPSPPKRPYPNLYNEEDNPNIRYYFSEKEQTPKYKLVPYEQTPPVKVTYVQPAPIRIPYEQVQHKMPYDQTSTIKVSYDQHPVKPTYEPEKVVYEQTPEKLHYEQPSVPVVYEKPPVKEAIDISSIKAPYVSTVKIPNTYKPKLPENENIYVPRKPVIVSVLVPKELYVKPRPVRPLFTYDSGNSDSVRKQPAIISESYYEKQRPQTVVAEPVIESGFKPIVGPTEFATEAPVFTSTLSQEPTKPDYEVEKQPLSFIPIKSTPLKTETNPNYYKYAEPTSPKKPSAETLATLLNSLQVNKTIPKPITRQNVASSIRTLLQVLNTLKAAQQNKGDLNGPVLSTPTPFVSSKVVVNNHELAVAPSPEIIDTDLHEDPYLAQVHTPSQHLDDDHPIRGGSSQQFPLPVLSDDEGGTPGVPDVDYPVLSVIPPTSFSCKSQRYKGFFADTETRCQVWHYCDLNGGQASFLCPNGTIFSQAGLTCDWWFNVRCASATQLYVLNESLYKYILPHSPKFPEDYSGPLVDKYLTLKFKEMEEEFKKNKSKHTDEKIDSEEDDDSFKESSDVTQSSSEMDKRQLSELSEASVIVESAGNSGKVVRLET